MPSVSRKPVLWLATHNLGKVDEFKVLLEGIPFEVKHPEKYQAPEETGKTFLENAQIKLEVFQKNVDSKDWVLAEDSGIEVSALGNKPGVYSARYLSEKMSWNERLQGLLNEMKDVPQNLRQARMVSVITAGKKGHTPIQARGEVQGIISSSIRGNKGFAYDFIFIPQGENQTIGELGLSYKNQFSHRFRAVEYFKHQLESF